MTEAEMEQVAQVPRPGKKPAYWGIHREMADAYAELQKLRIGMGNRRSAIAASGTDTLPKDLDPNADGALWGRLESELLSLEKAVAGSLPPLVVDHAIGPWLLAVKGIGPVIAAKLIGYIGDARRFTTISKMWRYAGMAVIDGKAERMHRGQRGHYHPGLKTTCYLVGVAMLKSDSPYRRIYDDSYARYLAERPDWSGCRTCGTTIAECREKAAHSKVTARTATRGWNTGRVNNAARRRMVKIFLANLWEAWYRIAGTPMPSRPYAFSVLGHNDHDYVSPESMVDFPLPPPVYGGEA